MSIEGFVEYRRREFCNDVKCSVQVELNRRESGSEEYEKVRKTCSTGCLYTTWQFHHWLIEKGYIIVASLKIKNKGDLITAIDKDLLQWMDKQVQSGKYPNRGKIIEEALDQYKKS